MSNDDEAIAREAYRQWCASDCPGRDDVIDVAKIAVGLTRNGWKPPPPEVLAFREWASNRWVSLSHHIAKGDWDQCDAAVAFEAGAKWATNRSNQRTVSLVEALNLYGDWDNCDADLESVLSAVGEGRL